MLMVGPTTRAGQGGRTMAERLDGPVRLVELLRSHGLQAEYHEASLDELLDDPIMPLLWRRDGLEPDYARDMIRALLTSIRRVRSATGSVEVRRARRRPVAGMAA